MPFKPNVPLLPQQAVTELRDASCSPASPAGRRGGGGGGGAGAGGNAPLSRVASMLFRLPDLDRCATRMLHRTCGPSELVSTLTTLLRAHTKAAAVARDATGADGREQGSCSSGDGGGGSGGGSEGGGNAAAGGGGGGGGDSSGVPRVCALLRALLSAAASSDVEAAINRMLGRLDKK
eukprot:364241-Chlamydomonas_euryale.AAC.1